MQTDDWLNENAEKAKAEQMAKAVDFAQAYLVFVDDARGRELLQHWIDTVEQRNVAPSASVQEFAYWEGRRAFIRGIQQQTKLAKSGGQRQ